MNWSKALPSEEGLYWLMRANEWKAPQVVKVYRTPAVDPVWSMGKRVESHLRVQFLGTAAEYPVKDLTEESWMGPIECPQLPEDAK